MSVANSPKSWPEGLLAHWLDALCVGCPPASLIHVGAGRVADLGDDKLRRVYSRASGVLAIEGDAVRAGVLRRNCVSQHHVHVWQGVVAPAAGVVRFIHSSIGDESGICLPDQLAAIWPRQRVLRAEEVNARTVDQCWAEQSQAAAAPPNWLFIDCLPGFELLKGAVNVLRGVDVLLLRAVRPANLSGEAASAMSSLSVESFQEFLAKQGLDLVGAEEENHPALVTALFARDQSNRWRVQLAEASEEHESKLRAARTEVERLTLEHDAAAHLAAQYQARMQSLAAAAEQADKQLVDKQVLIDQLIKVRDEKTREAQTARADVERLQLEKADAERFASEREAQIRELEKSLRSAQGGAEQAAKRLAHLSTEAATLVAARNEEARSSQEKDKKIEALNGELAELSARQALLEEELAKAGAQIELIADVLLREPLTSVC